ncbi:hypothetical protein [Lysobacter solisilvae (ex Woo and Kim 2020)]|uniref:DUF4234 domain-containing protein n=1 Tax=Agrilutibacter terrestris TaxID=2865112 RepID=A0A7H0FTM3_9GAMM|nr:hypothetical protein [Lysobacter terrestris]QNP39389.1 hypothetical protein H8B22_07460 [Lysobacter terrestris]
MDAGTLAATARRIKEDTLEETLEANLYAPPTAVVMDAPARVRAPEFYVVARTKFIVLLVATLGMYQIYWFYRHWARYRSYNKANISPIWRAIFPVFFAHSLGRDIRQSLARTGIAHRWWPNLLAWGYVVAQIISTVCDRLAAKEIGSPTTDLVATVALLPIGYCMWGLQKAANLACAQPHGESNRDFTWANWVWIVIGALLWLVILLGWAVMLGWITFD